MPWCKLLVITSVRSESCNIGVAWNIQQNPSTLHQQVHFVLSGRKTDQSSRQQKWCVKSNVCYCMAGCINNMSHYSERGTGSFHGMFFTDCPEGCHNDNFWWGQWLVFWQGDCISKVNVSVKKYIELYAEILIMPSTVCICDYGGMMNWKDDNDNTCNYDTNDNNNWYN